MEPQLTKMKNNIILIENGQVKDNSVKTNETSNLGGIPRLEDQIGKSLGGNMMLPEYHKTTNYYQEFWKLYLQNEILINQMRECSAENRQMNEKITKYEEILVTIENNLNPRFTKKKNRRVASQIDRSHACPYEGCNKVYGSDVSLNLHIKLKHNGGNKTEREKLAVTKKTQKF
eukprot:TRINITY_DN8080_c0_g1_i1.p1 TRINITY_DN8080_c0_g1~~TRINITY_DN8080_c0_g1_i1.p1  ORF type:complete len:174 (-),score=38.58 TRINITY_DN8080_c0_g1_i1:227-748(-)